MTAVETFILFFITIGIPALTYVRTYHDSH